MKKFQKPAFYLSNASHCQVHRQPKVVEMTIHRNREAISRKGQGLPLNTIILAILALVVLVVLLFMVGRRLGVFGEALASCDAQDGTCVAQDVCQRVDTSITIKGTKCAQATPVCCKALVPQSGGEPCAGPKDCVSKNCQGFVCA
jgi:hypothetical protein